MEIMGRFRNIDRAYVILLCCLLNDLQMSPPIIDYLSFPIFYLMHKFCVCSIFDRIKSIPKGTYKRSLNSFFIAFILQKEEEEIAIAKYKFTI